MKHDLPPFAVLIDADNVRLDTITPILEEITRHARITVRRIYGDFTSQNLAGWKTKLAENAIQPIQQYRNTTGKNASDSALIIDAMDLLHSRRFDGFCLISSDSDFTRLATRIREDGLVVYGFGEMKAPKAFVNACDRYIYVENLLNAPVAAAVPIQPQVVVTAEAEAPHPDVPPTVAVLPPAEALPTPVNGVRPAEPDNARPDEFKPPAFASALLLRAFANVADEQGWAMVGRLSTYIHDNHSDFDPRTYGCSKFIDLLQKNGELELVLRDYKNGQSYFCRPKRLAQPVVMSGSRERLSDLQQAVSEAASADGWAAIGMVGQKLKGLGRTVKEFGSSSLTEALKAADRFDMRGSGAARYVRLKPTTQ